MVPEKQVLTMRRIRDITPILKTFLYRGKRRMLVKFIIYALALQKGKHSPAGKLSLFVAYFHSANIVVIPRYIAYLPLE